MHMYHYCIIIAHVWCSLDILHKLQFIIHLTIQLIAHQNNLQTKKKSPCYSYSTMTSLRLDCFVLCTYHMKCHSIHCILHYMLYSVYPAYIMYSMLCIYTTLLKYIWTGLKKIGTLLSVLIEANLNNLYWASYLDEILDIHSRLIFF